MVKKLLLFAILSPMAMQPVMKANVIVKTITNIFTPWDPNVKGFNKGFELLLSACALGIKGYDYVQPFAKKADYRNAWNIPVQRNAAILYSCVWWLKKALAMNEFYRVGTTFRNQARQPIDYTFSIMRMLGIFGGQLLEDTHRETVCTKTGIPVWKPILETDK